MVGGGHFVEGGLIARTRDGGATWAVRTNVVPREIRPADYYLRSVQFVDAERGWISADAGRILRTDDGGETWARQQVPSNTRVLDLFFLDRDVGWAVTFSEMLLTTDGGDSWTRVEEQYGVGACWAIQFLDRQNGIAAGRAGILRSSDGGHAWQKVEAPDVDYAAVDFPSAGAGWAVGEGGTILHTTDGGKSWQGQTSGVTALLRDVRFLDDLRGWVVGTMPGHDKSVILWTEEAGTTWTLQQEVPGLELLTIAALDAGHAWTAGRRISVEGPQTMLRLAP
jgi:photosystem II stability/assembly factor-like uncharacterized protein